MRVLVAGASGAIGTRLVPPIHRSTRPSRGPASDARMPSICRRFREWAIQDSNLEPLPYQRRLGVRRCHRKSLTCRDFGPVALTTEAADTQLRFRQGSVPVVVKR
jgi:hypothetical protein